MNAKDFLRLGVPLGQATDFVAGFILNGGQFENPNERGYEIRLGGYFVHRAEPWETQSESSNSGVNGLHTQLCVEHVTPFRWMAMGLSALLLKIPVLIVEVVADATLRWRPSTI
jgi:hypothetical protein